MKKVVLLLLLGVSTVSFAAVVPVNSAAPRKPAVTRPDATKMKMMVKAKTLPNSVGTESISQLQRYNGAVTMDNVRAIENMSRLMQDDPDALMQQLAGPNGVVNFTVDRRKMGTDEEVDAYVGSLETDDPAEKLGSVNTPELLGSFAGSRRSEEDLKIMHQNALKQVEEAGHKHLGEKTAPIRMPVTEKEITEMGIDERRLPQNWKETVKKAEATRKFYHTQDARKKVEAVQKEVANESQKQVGQATTPQKSRGTQSQSKTVPAKTIQRTR